MPLSAYQTDYLLLLVGGNPLPVYVSATQLATELTQVKLLYSPPRDGSRHTKTLAGYLQKAIEQKVRCAVELLDVSSADGRKICSKLAALIETIPEEATVGVNYTGGTKQMVVYTLQILEKKYGPRLVRSYLNAQDRQMYIDDGTYVNPVPVQTGDQITFDDLLYLHGYKRVSSALLPNIQHETVVDALFTVHQTEAGIQAWYDWRRNEYAKSKALPTVENYPNLRPVIEVIERICEGKPAPELVARYLNCKNGDFSSCANWFKGVWFEQWVVREVLSVAERFDVHSAGTNLIIQREDRQSGSIRMEIDMVVMLNYQLFAISCIASSLDKGETKKHLFEAYTRARQLGGDEARVALVYLGDGKEKLEHEINRDWLVSDAITVFGRNELRNFQRELYGWFKRNS